MKHNTTELRALLAQAARILEAATAALDRLEAEAEAAEKLDRTMLSVDEAAAALGLSRSTVNRRIADGTLRSVRLEGRRLIPAAELRLVADAAA